jgi:Domain of unknown function (DUF5666)
MKTATTLSRAGIASGRGARGVGGALASLLAAVAAAFALVACGGGGGGGDPGTGGTGSFSRGAITGFGSIIVNGVRHDDSRASVSDEDDEDSPGRSKDDLKLGMVVTVSGSAGTGTGTATANVITFGSELKGPVASINGSTSTATGTSTGTPTAVTGTQTLVIIGQTVLIGTRTVFDPLTLPGGFADIGVGNILEVHGHLDAAANKLVATRISKENNANKFKISGRVASFNAGSKTFMIGDETFNYAGADPDKIRVALADGINVKLRLTTAVPTATGSWQVTRIKSAARKGLEDKAKAELEGIVADLKTNTFTVNGIEVDATNAQFPKGRDGLVDGARVEVKGSLVGGVLIASRVKIEDDKDEDNEIELHGLVSGLDTTTKTFDLRGLKVDYSAARFERGSAADLANGRNVEVKGSSANGGVVMATKIEFEN